jgi:hypothetical protein
MDPHQIERLDSEPDPHPHQSDKLHLDTHPHQSDKLDPIRIRINLQMTSQNVLNTV